MANEIINQLRTFLFTQRTLRQSGKTTDIQKNIERIIGVAKTNNMFFRANRQNLTNGWKNGWYVTQGDDPRKNTSYQAANCDNGSDLNFTFLRLGSLDKSGEKIEENGTTGKGFMYSGVMKYSPEMYGDGIFAVVVDVKPEKNAKFAFWLKNYETDVNEIDVAEVFNLKIRNWFGNRLMKAVFTLHKGKSYTSGHEQIPHSVWFGQGFHVFELERLAGKLTWRVDGFTVKTEIDPDKSVKYGVILDYEVWGSSVANPPVVSRIKEMLIYTK